MNRDASNAEPQGPENGSTEELFESLLEAVDDASAHGQTPRDLHDTRLPSELRTQLADLGQCVSLLNEAARHGLLTSFDPSAAWGGPFTGPTPADVDASVRGERIGRFEIVRELGRGGYGVVFLARDAAAGREVALKLPRPEALITPQLRSRFLRESQAAGRLDHPHVLQIYEVGEDGGLCYLISPYCRGPTLARWLSENRQGVDVREAAHLVACLADGLEQAHRHDVLHRDIKPGNVLLDLSATEQPAAGARLAARSLTSFVPKLSDFGLAKIVQAGEQETRTGAVLGTPAYMAPEQAAGRLHEVGPATDIYALGAVLYEMLTGRPPHVGANDAQTLTRVATAEPVAPRRLRPAIPRDLDAICQKCLEKNPRDRYAAAHELARDLQRFLAGEPTLARPVGPIRRLWRHARRRPAVTSLAAAAAALVVVLAAGSWWYSTRLASDEAALQRSWYARDMRAAIDAREHGEHAQARALMARYADGTPGASQRGFEWHWLRDALDEQVRTLPAGHGEAYGVVFSPDGKTLYSGGKDGVIRAWDPATGGLQFELRGHADSARASGTPQEACVNQLAIIDDGLTLASASCDHTVRLWNLAERREIGRLGDYQAKVFSIAVSHDGKLFATGTNDGQVRVWSVAENRLLQVLELAGRDVAIDVVAFRGDDQVLAATAGTGLIALWDTSTWQRIDTRADMCRALAFVGQGQELVVAAGISGPIKISQLVRDRGRYLPQEIASSQTNVTHLLSLHQGDIGFAASFNGSVRAFATNGLAARRILNCGGIRVQALALSPDDRLLAAACFDGNVRLWDLERSDPRLPAIDNQARLVQAWLIPHAGLTAAMDDKYRLYLCHGTTGMFEPLSGFQNDLRLCSASGKIFAAAEQGTGRVQLIDAQTRTALPHFQDLSNPAAFAVSADDATLAILDSSFVLRIFEISTGKVRCQVPLKRSIAVDLLQMALTPDGSTVVFIRQGHLFADALDTRTARWVAPPADLDFLSVAACSPEFHSFSPDGRMNAHMDSHDTVVITAQPSGEVLHILRHDNNLIGGFGWSADGRRLAVRTRRDTVVLFDPVSGEAMGKLDGGLEPLISNLVFSADGQTLTALCGNIANAGGHWRIWHAPSD